MGGRGHDPPTPFIHPFYCSRNLHVQDLNQWGSHCWTSLSVRIKPFCWRLCRYSWRQARRSPLGTFRRQHPELEDMIPDHFVKLYFVAKPVGIGFLAVAFSSELWHLYLSYCLISIGYPGAGTGLTTGSAHIHP